MQYTNLGRTGLKVSRICLGMMTYGTPKWRPWVLDEDASRPFVKRALELGINFFDTADMYSDGVSEQVLGRAIRDFARREDVVIATKVFYPAGPSVNDRGLSRKHILAAIDASLGRLGMDHVDLYQIHRYDPETPIEETLEALNDVVRAGKARYIGASSMFAWQFAQALAISDRRGSARFVSMQNHYNLIYREEEREMLPLCRSEGIGVIPWSPLARGLLAGSRRAGLQGDTARAESDDFARTLYTDSDLEVADRVVETARRRALAPARIALASSRAPASPRRSSAPAAWHTWTTRSRLSMSLSPKRSAVSSRSPTAPTKSAATSDRRSAIARDLGLWPTGERLGRMRP